MEKQSLVLASSSPRRKELLENLHLTFEVSSSEVDENFSITDSPDEIVMELAEKKAKAVAKFYPSSYIIGSDTVVVTNGNILGKPKEKNEAFLMLKTLSGNVHHVYTGVCIVSPDQTINFYEKTEVVFWELTDEEIDSYISTGEPFDKAGAYGIQGIGSILVKEIKGDYFSVVGLPLSRTVRELKKAGFRLPY